MIIICSVLRCRNYRRCPQTERRKSWFHGWSFCQRMESSDCSEVRTFQGYPRVLLPRLNFQIVPCQVIRSFLRQNHFIFFSQLWNCSRAPRRQIISARVSSFFTFPPVIPVQKFGWRSNIFFPYFYFRVRYLKYRLGAIFNHIPYQDNIEIPTDLLPEGWERFSGLSTL